MIVKSSKSKLQATEIGYKVRDQWGGLDHPEEGNRIGKYTEWEVGGRLEWEDQTVRMEARDKGQLKLRAM